MLVAWVGGKRLFYKHIRPLLPNKIGTYWEPFAGGAATWYQLHTDKLRPPPERAYLSDTNRELINVYRQCKHHPELLMSALDREKQKHKTGLVDYFYELRDIHSERDLADKPKGCRIEAAARLIVISKLCFSNKYTTSPDGKRCTSCPSYFATGKRPHGIYQHKIVMNAHAALQNTRLRVGDFRDITPSPGDTIYLDPPYDKRQIEYGAGGKFGLTLQHALQEHAQQWRNLGCHIVVSNSNTEYIKALWKGWHHTPVSRRMGVCHGRQDYTELLIHTKENM